MDENYRMAVNYLDIKDENQNVIYSYTDENEVKTVKGSKKINCTDNKEKKELPGCKERIDWHFLKYMITFRIKKRRKIEENINKIAKEKVIIFYKRKELNKWLADIQNKAN